MAESHDSASGQRRNVTITLSVAKMAALEITADHNNKSVDDLISEILDRAMLVHVEVLLRR